MVELNTLLLVAMVGAGFSFTALLVIGLLIGIFLKVKKVETTLAEEDERMVLPLSSVLGGGGQGTNLSELMKQYYASGGGAKPEAKKAAEGGQYL